MHLRYYGIGNFKISILEEYYNKDIDKLFSDEDWRSVNSCINTVRRSMNEIEHNISQEINAISFYEG